MGFLGHKDGPRMSEILKRYRNELLHRVHLFGPDDIGISDDEVDMLLASEVSDEDQSLLTLVEIPVGYGARKGEFRYSRCIPETSKCIELFYRLTEGEKQQLGTEYKSKEVELVPHKKAKKASGMA